MKLNWSYKGEDDEHSQHRNNEKNDVNTHNPKAVKLHFLIIEDADLLDPPILGFLAEKIGESCLVVWPHLLGSRREFVATSKNEKLLKKLRNDLTLESAHTCVEDDFFTTLSRSILEDWILQAYNFSSRTTLLLMQTYHLGETTTMPDRLIYENHNMGA